MCVCPSPWNNSAPIEGGGGRIFIKFEILVFFQKVAGDRKFNE
jgi:hypothetical protein